jgi:hypothetical protein
VARLHGEPFVAIYKRFLFHDPPLPDRAIRLLLVLQSHAITSDEAHPSRPRLAELTGYSTDTLDRAIADLTAVGAVTIERTARPGGGHPLVSYWLWPTTPDDKTAPTRTRNRTDADSKPHESGIEPESRLLLGLEVDEGKKNPESRFDEFYVPYPRHVARADAKRAWDKAVKRADPDTIIAAARMFAAFPGCERDFIPYPATWLNKDRWLDERPTPKANGGGRDAGMMTDRSQPSGYIEDL